MIDELGGVCCFRPLANMPVSGNKIDKSGVVISKLTGYSSFLLLLGLKVLTLVILVRSWHLCCHVTQLNDSRFLCICYLITWRSVMVANVHSTILFYFILKKNHNKTHEGQSIAKWENQMNSNSTIMSTM